MRRNITISRILCIGIGLLFFLSCKKDREVADYTGDYEISGKVLDEITGKPVPYCHVGVLSQKRGQTSYLGTKSVVTKRADAEGRFSLKFYADATENNYSLTSRALNYFDPRGYDITFTKSGNSTQNIHLMPHSYITYRIKGTIDSIDYKRISIYKAGVFYNRNPHDHSRLTDTVATGAYITPLQDFRIIYSVSKGWGADVTNLYTIDKTIQGPPPHDTIYYVIEF